MLCNAELNSFDSSYLTQLTLGAPHAQVNFSIHIIRIFNFKMIIFLMQAEYLHFIAATATCCCTRYIFSNKKCFVMGFGCD